MRSNYLIYTIVFFIVNINFSFAQPHEQNLTKLLARLSLKNGVAISFSNSITDTIYPINNIITTNTESSLESILYNTGLDYKMIDKNYIIYKVTPIIDIEVIEIDFDIYEPIISEQIIPPKEKVKLVRKYYNIEILELPFTNLKLEKKTNNYNFPLIKYAYIKPATKFQRWVIKTNVLYDLTTTINLGVEFFINNKFSLDFSFNYNPWEFKNYNKLKHWLVAPEFRYWFNGNNKHFIGVNAQFGQFNCAGIFNIFKYRYEGNIASLGAVYGYKWALNKRFSMESSIGIGYAWLNYNKYMCVKCGEKFPKENKKYFGVTKASLSIIYTL